MASQPIMTVQTNDNRDDDARLESFLHHWNRLPKRIRLDAAELIKDSHGEEIEP